MKALCWHGTGDVRYETVPDPKVEAAGDVIVRVTRTAICGSDLHIYGGIVPTMEAGDVLGHEFMGEIVEVGKECKKFKKGDRVVVPFCISCGECFFCKEKLYSLCDVSNPNAAKAREMMGQSPAGLFGYSHMLGGFAGGQAEYVRVPYGDVGPVLIPEGLDDERVLFLSDIFPTGYMAAENAEIKPGETVAVWGCGPVGQFAIQSSWMLRAGRVIAIDRVPERLAMAREYGKAETLNFDEVDVYEQLMAMTGGRGPDRCIDAVGAEAHGGSSIQAALDKAKVMLCLGTDRPEVLRQVIMCCRKGGTISVPGVYLGYLDKIPFGALMNKGLTLKTGQTHMQRYMTPLLERISRKEIDPSFVITHRLKLSEGPAAYQTFRDKQEGCIKVVMTP